MTQVLLLIFHSRDEPFIFCRHRLLPSSEACFGPPIERGVRRALNDWEVLLQPHLILSAQDPIQIECGANQGKMREGLRKIAQRLALRPCLLSIKSEMIGVTQHAFEY
jgi:hypothetical protein